MDMYDHNESMRSKEFLKKVYVSEITVDKRNYPPEGRRMGQKVMCVKELGLGLGLKRYLQVIDWQWTGKESQERFRMDGEGERLGRVRCEVRHKGLVCPCMEYSLHV